MKYKDKDGQWQELYLKPAGDTLPIGTVVDYNGETVPYGYEEVEDDKPIDISEYFSTPFTKTLLKAFYYPSIKKVDLIFNISSITGADNNWIEFITINNDKYKPKSDIELYSTCYGSSATTRYCAVLQSKLKFYKGGNIASGNLSYIVN